MNKLTEINEATIQISDSTYSIKEISTSPCKLACPIETDVKSYLGLIVVGKYEKALEIVKKDNPIPGICGRVCIHPCETECSRNKLDQPLSICALKRFLSDYEFKMGRKKQTPIKITKKDKVAIVGAGPAGLTAATDLIRLGYKVTIFEELSVPGGMLFAGIPAYRLPRNIIQDEIEAIKELGVEIKTDTRITDINKLKDYRAIFLAIGAHKGLKLDIPGEIEFEGVIDCVTFLRAINIGDGVKIGKQVVVIGGGNAAIDSARTALRLGSEVHIIYRRSRSEMPANPCEVEEAEKEGVKIHYLATPVKIIGKNGKTVAIECIKNELGTPDSSGRRRPIPMKGSEYTIPVDTIIPAISQEPDLSFLPSGFNISKWNSLMVDEETLSTNIEGVFAAGDCVTGPKTVIEAISAGHMAAKSIDRYLRGAEFFKKEKPIWDKKEWEIVIEPTEKKQRHIMPSLPLDKRNSFDEVEIGFDEAMATEEASRCLRCGPCSECYECIRECDKKLVSLMFKDNGILLRIPSYLIFPMYPVEAKILEEKVTIEPITCEVDEKLCRGCGDCESVCEYGACKVKTQVAKVDASLCKCCGVCTTVCPSGAMNQAHFTNDRIYEFIVRAI